MQFPVMFTVPLEALIIPYPGPLRVPMCPVAFPVRLMVPVPVLAAPLLPLLFPKRFPVMFIVPVPLFWTGYAFVVPPGAVQLPIRLRTPPPKCNIAGWPFPPPETLEAMAQDCPACNAEPSTVCPPFPITPAEVQINVIPSVGTNDPPAVTPVADALRMLKTVGDTSMVTVNVLL